MGFYQLRLIGNGTDLESQLKTLIARYRARDPWSARPTPHMLREGWGERGEREGRKRDTQTDRQGRLGHRAPLPTPVKSHSYTPKVQTIFTLMLSRATKAIKWSYAGGPMMVRFCGIWILSPLINLNDMKYKKTLSESKLSGPASAERERARIWCP